MMAYVDTNVILGGYCRGDPLSSKALSFLKEEERRKLASPISLVELAAVLSRIDYALDAPEELLQETPKRRIRALVDYMIKQSGLRIVSVPAKIKLRLGGATISVPIEYHSCIRFAHALKLKTLDILHLTYADNLAKWGYDVDVFATFDQEILGKKDQIHQLFSFEVTEP